MSQRGFVLIGTLCLCVLTGLIGLYLHRQSLTLSIAWSGQRHHFLAQNQSAVLAFQAAAADTQPVLPGQTMRCFTQNSAVGHSQSQYQLCSLRNTVPTQTLQKGNIAGFSQGLLQPFPRIDYNYLFLHTQACPARPARCLAASTKFPLLVADPVCAAVSCELSQSMLTSEAVFDANLDSRQLLRLTSSPDQTQAFLLAATGYIKISAPLQLEHDLLVIAGGDISLASVDTRGDPALTLVSATGSISVKQIHGKLRLKYIARLASDRAYPDTFSLLIPPLREREILSLE